MDISNSYQICCNKGYVIMFGVSYSTLNLIHVVAVSYLKC